MAYHCCSYRKAFQWSSDFYWSLGHCCQRGLELYAVVCCLHSTWLMSHLQSDKQHSKLSQAPCTLSHICLSCHACTVSCHTSAAPCQTSAAPCHTSAAPCHTSPAPCHTSAAPCHTSAVPCYTCTVSCHTSVQNCHISASRCRRSIVPCCISTIACHTSTAQWHLSAIHWLRCIHMLCTCTARRQISVLDDRSRIPPIDNLVTDWINATITPHKNKELYWLAYQLSMGGICCWHQAVRTIGHNTKRSFCRHCFSSAV